jgi:FixJ family two-component response regulator
LPFISPVTNNFGTMASQPKNDSAEDTFGRFQPGDVKSPTILVLDDSDIVCDFLQCMFQSYGYRTLLASTKEQAIEHCKREGDTIGTLIADVRLGLCEGSKTVAALTKICSGMRVVLTSGYPHQHLVLAGLLAGDLGTVVFLQKPFLPREILSAVKPQQGISSPLRTDPSCKPMKTLACGA